MHIEILQSPWLSELMAFHINMRETKGNSRKAPALFEGCSLVLDDGKPSLSCDVFDSLKLEINLTCSICLVSFQLYYLSDNTYTEAVACILVEKFSTGLALSALYTMCSVWHWKMKAILLFIVSLSTNDAHKKRQVKLILMRHVGSLDS